MLFHTSTFYFSFSSVVHNVISDQYIFTLFLFAIIIFIERQFYLGNFLCKLINL